MGADIIAQPIKRCHLDNEFHMSEIIKAIYNISLSDIPGLVFSRSQN